MAYTSKDAEAQFHLTSEQEAHVLELSRVEDITAYMRECSVINGAFKPLEGAAPDKLVAVPADQQPQQVSVRIGDRTITGTQAQIDEAVRAAVTAQQQDDQPARDRATGRFAKESPADQGQSDEAAALRAADAAELELRWKRGEITGTEYLDKSGAMDDYLKSRGIDVAAHQSERQENKKYETSWADAATAWKKQHPDWPGGTEMTAAVAERIEALGLSDTPSVDSVNRAVTALNIEADMHAETNTDKLEALKERYRQEVMGRTGSPR